MKVLLDTHTFLWLDGYSSRLSPKAIDILTDPSHELFLSIASVWELTIKVALGKLVLRDDLAVVVQDQTTRNPIQLLPISLEDVMAVRTLPLLHKDPFDRMLVAQARILNATLLTMDPLIRQYPVRTDW